MYGESKQIAKHHLSLRNQPALAGFFFPIHIDFTDSVQGIFFTLSQLQKSKAFCVIILYIYVFILRKIDYKSPINFPIPNILSVAFCIDSRMGSADRRTQTIVALVDLYPNDLPIICKLEPEIACHEPSVRLIS